MKRQVFKPYTQDQAMLLPPSLEELIPAGHIVRVVDEMIEQLDLSVLERQYKGGGTSVIDPNKCNDCAICVEECPLELIIPEFKYDPELE